MPEIKKQNQSGIVLKERESSVPKKPRKYNVLLHNDDFSPMEFVVGILMTIFKHSLEKATEIMLHVHTKGVGIAGTYTQEIAETKVVTVTEIAKKFEWPLMATMEPESNDQ